MVHDLFDLDKQQKIRYVSESSNASTSGYSTMSPGGPNAALGNLSPASVSSSMYSSPAHSPATALQTEFSNLNLPANSPQHQQLQHSPHFVALQGGGVGNNNIAVDMVYNSSSSNSYTNFSHMNNVLAPMVTIPQAQQQFFGMPTAMHATGPLQQQQQSPVVSIKNEYSAELRIIEQPVEKFRFRYKSEMHGTHGSLNGANSKRTPKTFPEVELRNFNGKAVIRCSLFQKDIDSPHSHQLVVRKDDVDICDPHDVPVSPESGYIAQFQNMGIIHTAKKFIFDELLKKKTNRMKFELGRDELSTKQLQELHKETEKEAKEMNLNQVRLCFEAFKVEDNGTWARIAAPVYTNSINNRKAAQTGELRICRLSIATGSVSGNDDLILLVEKVSKKNIKVRFYELNEDDETIWEDFGKFRESDVHHQYAIVCQTPAYKDKDIEKPVDVYIELVRPTDDERSFPAVTFRYKPRDAVVSRKRRRTCSTATSSSGSGSLSGSYEIPKTVQERTELLPPITKTRLFNISNVTPAMANNATATGINATGANLTISQEYDKDAELQKMLASEQSLQNLIRSEDFRAFITSEELYNLCPEFSNIPEVQMDTGNANVGDCQMVEVGRLETDGAGAANSSSSADLKARQNSMPAKDHRKMLLMSALSSTIVPLGNIFLRQIFRIYEETRNAKVITPEKQKNAAQQVAKIFNAHAERNDHGDTLLHEIITSDDRRLGFKMCQILSYFKLGDELLNNRLNTYNESALHCACMHDRALYIRPLLSLGCDPNIQDSKGNTALHIAVKEQHHNCIESFLKMTNLRLDLSKHNDEGLTPLHLAIRLKNYAVAEKLLQLDKHAAYACNTKDGNTALHLAVLQHNLQLIKIIVDKQNNNSLLSVRNAAGQTAYELARLCTTAEGNAIFKYLSMLGSKSHGDDDTNTLPPTPPMLTIKEEELSSSSTDDENEPMDLMTVKEEPLDAADDKEYTKSTIALAAATTDMNDIQMAATNLAQLLNNETIFKKLVQRLDATAKWKQLTAKSKMQHLICLWSNAEDMLNYVKMNAHSIGYNVFVNALAEVDKEAWQLLQT